MSKIPRLSQIAPLTPIQKELSRSFKLLEKRGFYRPHNSEVARIIQNDRSGFAITEMNIQARIQLWKVRDHYEDKINVSDIDSKRLVSLAGFVKSRGRGGLSTAWTGLHYLEWDKVHRHKDYEVKVPYEFYVPVPVLGNLLGVKATLEYQTKFMYGLMHHVNTNRDYVNRLIADGYTDHSAVTQYHKTVDDLEKIQSIVAEAEKQMTELRHREVTYYLRWLDKIIRHHGIEKFFLPVVVKKMLLREPLLDTDYITHVELTDISTLFHP